MYGGSTAAAETDLSRCHPPSVRDTVNQPPSVSTPGETDSQDGASIYRASVPGFSWRAPQSASPPPARSRFHLGLVEIDMDRRVWGTRPCTGGLVLARQRDPKCYLLTYLLTALTHLLTYSLTYLLTALRGSK